MIEDRLKRLEKDTDVSITSEGFIDHWQEVMENPGWMYHKQKDRLIMANLLILNEELNRVKAELQELKSFPNGLKKEDSFLSILHLWITSHPDQEICTKDLFINLKAISQDKGLLFTLPDARALGVKIKQYEEELKQKYSLTSRTGAGNVRYYSFKEAGLE